MTQIWFLLTCALHLFISDYPDPPGAQLELAYQGVPIYSMQITKTQAGSFISGAALLASQQQTQVNSNNRGNRSPGSQEPSRALMQGGVENSPEHLIFLEPSMRYSQVYMVFPFREGVAELKGLLETLRGGGGEASEGEASSDKTMQDGTSLDETQGVTDPLGQYSTEVLPATIVDLTQVLLQIPGGFSSSVTTTNLPRTIRVVANGENVFISRTPSGYIVGDPIRGISITIILSE